MRPLAEWPQATTVEAGELRLVMRKLHEAMCLGVPFQLTINSDGKRLNVVDLKVAVIRNGEEVCGVVPADYLTM